MTYFLKSYIEMNLSCDSSADQPSFHHVYQHHYQRPETVATSSGPATSSGIADVDNNHGMCGYFVDLKQPAYCSRFYIVKCELNMCK